MAVDGPAAANESQAPGGGPLRYDAFVVRLWREAATGRVLRAEVEHARTGARARAAGVPTGWVLDQIRARLTEAPPGDGGASEALAPKMVLPTQPSAPRHEPGPPLVEAEPRRR
jgi:hypothetical protein